MHISNPRVIVIEDDDYKAKALSDFLRSEWPSVYISIVKSLNSAINKLSSEKFDLALVDMSMPTYELASDRHGGGDPQGFAGEDILRFIDSESPSTKTVVVTQLSEFSDGSITRTLDEIAESLRSEFGPSYLGLISYSGRHGGWRDTLQEMLKKAGLLT